MCAFVEKYNEAYNTMKRTTRLIADQKNSKQSNTMWLRW